MVDSNKAKQLQGIKLLIKLVMSLLDLDKLILAYIIPLTQFHFLFWWGV